MMRDLFDLGRTCEKRPLPQVLGGYPPPPTEASIMSISDPRLGPREGPGASTKPENTVNTVFFACFDTHLLSGHCRASTVSIIDTRGFGGVSHARDTHPRVSIMSPSFLRGPRVPAPEPR